MKKDLRIVVCIPFILLCFTFGQSQTSDTGTNLSRGFNNPPNTAKPRVWWHWMNGNISKEGIQKDLDWMERVGIGGFQNFDANLFTPVVVAKKLVFMTPEWKDAFKFTTDLANKKGLEMAIAGSPGWSVTGGPWVVPKDAMKKYVWTETRISGGQQFSGKIKKPSSITGAFQNTMVASGGISGGFIGTLPDYYEDAALIAFRLPENDIDIRTLHPKVSSSGGSFSLDDLTDGDLTNVQFLPPKEVGEEIWIQYEFETPQTIKAFSVAGANHFAMEGFDGGPVNRSLKVSDDGIHFRQIATISGSIVPQNTVAIKATTAKYFRLVYTTLESETNLFALMAGAPPEAPKPKGVEVAEFVLYTADRIDQLEDKAGFTPWTEDNVTFVPQNADVIESDAIFDLSSKLEEDGTLQWKVPKGNWMILRLGYSLTGRQNHPASPEATGLEVDKLDKEAVKRYINTYLDMYKDATSGLMGEKGLGFMILDSYEAGHMNWTHNLPQEFEDRRGYDLHQWLPVLSGHIVESAASSEKFLWDFRKTIGEMIVDNHYDVIGEELHKRAMKRYTESHENKRVYLADGMDIKRNADIPMSAMWTPGSLNRGPDEEVRSEADIRESASVANIYGKPFVAAESMTSVGKPFQEYPERLKRTADLELASGLNRFVIHTSVHQPLDDKKPGFSLGPFGQYFTRQETWAELAKPWIDYLGRSSYLLQQGKNVADYLYLYGENTNITWVCREKLPPIPAGFEFDFVNATALLNAIETKDGKLVAQSGNAYEVLMLDGTSKLMTLPVLKKLGKLAKAGITIIGEQPESSPSLSDDSVEFSRLVNEIWALANVGIDQKVAAEPDVIISDTDHKILFRHRKDAQTDIYWLNNRNVNATNATVSFRIEGKVPELWNAQTGKTVKVSYQIKDGRTRIPLHFESWDAYFIIFKENAATNNFIAPTGARSVVQKISGDWKVDFNGHPEIFSTLTSWSNSENREVKYFSGTATYTIPFKMTRPVSGTTYEIDLGQVKNIAEVTLNDKNVGIFWKVPFRLDVTDELQKGRNILEVKVTNSWVNRLIGDAQPDVKEKTTFTTMPFYKKDSPLFPSGLLGPVTLLSVKEL
ncbi:MAG: glycoside hydrolase [Maribacter sp.]|nr:glycoside hydrolase [Maribacter sp.]